MTVDSRAVAALFLLNGALFGSWAARVPAFQDRFDLAHDALGLVLLCLAAGAIASFPLTGAWVDKRGVTKPARVLLVLYALSLPLVALAPNVWLLALALAGFGAAFGALDVVMNAWGAQLDAARARPMLPIYHALFSLGAGAGAGLAALAVAVRLNPLPHFSLVAVCAAAGALPFVLRGRAEKPIHTRTSKARGAVFPRGTLALVGLVAAATGLSEAAVADWSAVYLATVTAAPAHLAPLGFAAFSVAMVFVRLSGAWLVATLGAAPTTRLSGLFLALGAGCVSLGNGIGTVVFGFTLIGVGAALVMPLAFARAGSDPVVSPGTAIAQVALLGYGGLLLGPPLIGLVAAWTSLPASFLILVGLGALMTVLAPALAPRPLKPTPKTPS